MRCNRRVVVDGAGRRRRRRGAGGQRPSRRRTSATQAQLNDRSGRRTRRSFGRPRAAAWRSDHGADDTCHSPPGDARHTGARAPDQPAVPSTGALAGTRGTGVVRQRMGPTLARRRRDPRAANASNTTSCACRIKRRARSCTTPNAACCCCGGTASSPTRGAGRSRPAASNPGETPAEPRPRGDARGDGLAARARCGRSCTSTRPTAISDQVFHTFVADGATPRRRTDRRR